MRLALLAIAAAAVLLSACSSAPPAATPAQKAAASSECSRFASVWNVILDGTSSASSPLEASERAHRHFGDWNAALAGAEAPGARYGSTVNPASEVRISISGARAQLALLNLDEESRVLRIPHDWTALQKQLDRTGALCRKVAGES